MTTVARSQIHRAGQSEQISLSIAGNESRSTGHQLVVNIPDKKLESALSGFYGPPLTVGRLTIKIDMTLERDRRSFTTLVRVGLKL